VSTQVQEGLIKVLYALTNQPGLKAEKIAEAIHKAKPTTERYIKILREAKMIEYSEKNRMKGYFLIDPNKNSNKS